jgi:hypothetical protein
MSGTFEYVRIEDGVPEPEPRQDAVDVVVLDMNHRCPNLGHDALVFAVREAAESLAPETLVRVLSFDVRASFRVPVHRPGRRLLYLGSGGPGYLDPRANDGVSPLSQGVREDPAWEKPLFELFDAVAADENASLLAVCHSFGLLCRWSGLAGPVARRVKSAGIVENTLTNAAVAHPWFSRFAAKLPATRRFSVIDNRLFDLTTAAASERVLSVDPDDSTAATMIEFARGGAGPVPRILGVNHHPEVYDGARQRVLLAGMWERGEVTREWYEERASVVSTEASDPETERRVRLTSEYTLLSPLRIHLGRAIAATTGGEPPAPPSAPSDAAATLS